MFLCWMVCRFGIDNLVCYFVVSSLIFFFFKQKTAYEMRISDWSSDVCSSDLLPFTTTRPPLLCTGFWDTSICFMGVCKMACWKPAIYAWRRREIGRASCRERVCQYV